MSRPTRPDITPWIITPESVDEQGNVVEATYDLSHLSYDIDYMRRLMSNNVTPERLASAFEQFKACLKENWVLQVLRVDKENDEVDAFNKEAMNYNDTLTAEQEGFKRELKTFKDYPPAMDPGALKDYFAGNAIYIKWRKLNAFEFNGTVCSVTENDQNGWTSIDRLIEKREAAGAEWQPIPFKNENGNTVVLATKEEWEAFYFTAWDARVAFFGVSA
tara:strand:- start:649 stop:1302 length:654 start_codon:yes stop_codon:yes gene_type:complete